MNEPIDQLRRERDLYLRLLQLGTAEEVNRLLADTLDLVVDTLGAKHAYLALTTDDDEIHWAATDLSEQALEEIRGQISQGIVAQALASGESVLTLSAQLDPRFRDRASIQASGIESVLCTPIGGNPVAGAIYLEGKPGAEGFTDEDQDLLERVAHHLAPHARRILSPESKQESKDPTLEARQSLAAEGVIGRSSSLANVLKQAALVAPVDINVLISGASGTGKNQLARVIHASGPRAHAPFVEVNCAALPIDLIENELFGAVRGGHSTATEPVDGKVSAADGGTLFLDEIGDMPLSSQAKILQLLQNRQYYPLGSSTPRIANVRVISASNIDLDEAVQAKRFREDLLYRLRVLPVHMPPLAERKVDIIPIAEHFCEMHARNQKLAALTLSDGARLAIENTEWPGNVRQLANSIEAAVVRCAGDRRQVVELRHVFPERANDAPEGVLSFQEATRQFQRDYLVRRLEENGWNVARTARELDVARSHVYSLLRAFGITRDSDS